MNGADTETIISSVAQAMGCCGSEKAGCQIKGTVLTIRLGIYKVQSYVIPYMSLTYDWLVPYLTVCCTNCSITSRTTIIILSRTFAWQACRFSYFKECVSISTRELCVCKSENTSTGAQAKDCTAPVAKISNAESHL